MYLRACCEVSVVHTHLTVWRKSDVARDCSKGVMASSLHRLCLTASNTSFYNYWHSFRESAHNLFASAQPPCDLPCDRSDPAEKLTAVHCKMNSIRGSRNVPDTLKVRNQIRRLGMLPVM